MLLAICTPEVKKKKKKKMCKRDFRGFGKFAARVLEPRHSESVRTKS